MKTNKQIVYDYIVQMSIKQNEGVTTNIVASELDILRSNASSLLNELVKEGKLIKTNSRPIMYSLKGNNNLQDNSIFSKMIGHDGSLKKAVQLAKAAILYPQQSLNVLLISNVGCGITTFVYAMYDFAKMHGIIKEAAQYIKINCRHFAKNISILDSELFGSNGDLSTSCFSRAKGGVLFLDNADLLDVKQQSQLYTFLETNKIYSRDGKDSLEIKDVFVIVSHVLRSNIQLQRIIPVSISLPELKERPLKERFELINSFFSNEAMHSMRSIEVTAETIKALLLSEFKYNIKDLKFAIKAACANAYVRVISDNNENINVVVNDFSNQVKRSLINLKTKQIEIESLLSNRNVLIYDQKEGYQVYSNSKNENKMYGDIQKQYNELIELGITNQSITDVIHTHINNLFKKYNYLSRYDERTSLNQLTKIVNPRIIDIVSHFFNQTKKELGKNYRSNVFYGLCLHVNSLLSLNNPQQRLNNDQVVEIIQNHPQEYAACVQLGNIIRDEFNLECPVHEVALMAMFLLDSDEHEDNEPVLLYVMHGDTTATSLRDVTNSLTQSYNAYSYDLSLTIDINQALSDLTDLIIKINRGSGVIVIYDMGSIKTILETIEEETAIKIRAINMPITLVGIDIARRCTMENDIDYIYHTINLEINKLRNNEEKHNKVIITLCHTGEGGALQLKRYIDQYSKLNIKTIPLAISQKDVLIKEVTELKKTYDIHCFVGTYDPKLFGIPYISISKIFESPSEQIDHILMFEPISSTIFDYDAVYQYLEEQFKYVSVSKLKNVLPDIIDELNTIYDFNENQQVGLFMHIACLCERLLNQSSSITKLDDANKIINAFKEDYQFLVKILKPLEKIFNIIINDVEIAVIIMIIKKV